MHKWKLFKKSAALVLSSAVIASGVPVTAMASEAEVFSDVSGETQGETAQEEGENEDQESVSQDQPEVGEADIQSEEPEESDAEAIQEEVAEISAEEIQQEEEEQIQEDTKEVFGDGEAFMAEAGEVLQDASEITVAGVKYLWSMQPAEGYTQIGTTGVYVKAADGQTALTGKLYGTTTLSYSEFYAGDTTQESYDAITSATTSKNQIFTNEDSTEVTSSGYQIQGVKNVSVAVDAETYVAAQALKAASKLPREGVYTEAADITLNEAPSQEAGQYKTLNTDGTYSATKFDVKATVTDASAQIQAPSIWGDYMLVIKEAGTKYLRNSRQGDFAVGGNTLGVILETASGKKIGLRHTYEIWVQPYELAFSAGSGLIGEKISKVTYITPDGSYVYEFGDKAPLVKKQPEAGMKVQAAFVKENTTQVKVDDLDKYENPKVSVYYTTGSGHGKKTTYVVDHAVAENGVVTFDSSVARAGDEIYTVMISSDNYVDMTKNITLTGQPITVSNVSYYWVKGAVDGYTQIPGTDIYYKAANGHQALTGTLYGTASLSYEEFYAGDATSRKYDSVTSATTRKSTAFGNADVQNLTENGYEIAGVKKVSVATDAKTYVEARILSEAGELPESGVYTEAAGITLGRTPAVEPGQYKKLNTDGTYSATKFNVKATVTDAEATLNTSSRWGDYEIKVKETSTKYLRDTKSDADFAVNSGIQGMILETTDGGKYGMRHMNEMWLKVYKVADGIYIKPQATEEMDVSPEFTDSTHVKLANLDKYKNPKVSVFYTTGVGHDSQTTYLVQDGVAADGVVALDSTVARPENETYTVRVSSDDHADVSVQLVYGTIAFKENSGVLYIGSSRQLEATGENCKDVTYASDNETVASVDENGKVTAKAAGTAVITATSAAGKTAQYKLTVKTPSVKMNASAKTLYVKGTPATVTLKATTAGVTGKVTYTSSKPSVAAVAANGKVTAKAAGTAVITAKCGNYKATCKITVKKPAVKASASAKTVFVGGTSQIEVKKTGVSGKVTYTSSNRSVAVVSAGGKVTVKKAGTATITVKCGSYKATCRITVKKGSLKITSKTAVSVKAKKTTAIKAAATSKAKITYRSSNTKVATVSSKGVVKGVKKGKAVIYVSSNGITKKVTVTVK